MSVTMSVQLQVEPSLRASLHLIAGGVTGFPTVFPLTEKLLKRISIQEMLFQKYRLDERENGYRSVMDQLLCETLPSFWPGCLAFYMDKGPPFRDLYNKDFQQKIDQLLVSYLRVAKSLAKKKLWDGEFPQWGELIGGLAGPQGVSQ